MLRMTMPWELVGRAAIFIIAWVIAASVSAIVELYWPGVYEFLVDGAMTLGLLWLIVLRRP